MCPLISYVKVTIIALISDDEFRQMMLRYTPSGYFRSPLWEANVSMETVSGICKQRSYLPDTMIPPSKCLTDYEQILPSLCSHRPSENSQQHPSLPHLPPPDMLIVGSFLFSSSTSITPTLGYFSKVSYCQNESTEPPPDITGYLSLLSRPEKQ